MKAKLFQDGDKAVHLGAHVKKPNRAVTVLECINEHDPDDVAIPGQGYRYYVSYKGQVWSVPEWALRSR